ncbi:hypothetical protein JTE90_017878 [Oedothorax gibbosus]|uniref:WD repeat-containing protein 55 homolog n=1 Tax=Oedothorax gibbosus TaxID=931172 RepID=A0AAV6V418_9ARAC|nr:hypothetical protein JTE90_017878 [Oedothorax gibbosus]
MDDNEVIFVTRGPKCFMYNGAGHNLKQYKSEEIRPRTLARVGGDMMVGVCKKKPSLKSWILGESKHKVQEDFTIPGHATALAVSSCGQYCFVGIGKDLYVWKLTSGCLLSVIQQHYQDLSCIRVSADDDMVITGGKDGHVNVWLLVDLVQASDTSERRKTQFSWTNHSNEVTDIYNTPQGSCGRLATVSLDTTCRLYELNTGSLLTTVCLDVALSAVTMDTLECFIFCGDIFGELHCINIYEGLQREIHANEPVNKKIKIHEQKIVNLEVNFDGSLLLTASEDCIKVFMLDSFSLMTRIDEENCCGGITNAMFVSIPLRL